MVTVRIVYVAKLMPQIGRKMMILNISQYVGNITYAVCHTFILICNTYLD